MAIGQGDVAVTPLELNDYISTIANGGNLCKTHINLGSKEDCKKINVEKKNLDLVKEGMIGVCATGGTGYTFFDFKSDSLSPVACKTGTAQIGASEDTHAWFTLFAPANLPQIVLTVVVEKGGEGSRVGGPIARSIMDYWNLRNNP
jgi:penicillin-binding protein 2